MKLYTTTRDYITEVVLPALGDQADDFNVEGIATSMLTRCNVIDPRTGYIHDNHSGFVERQDIWFWDVVAAHCISDDEDEGPETGDFYFDQATGFQFLAPNGDWQVPTEQGRRMAAAMLDMSHDDREGNVGDVYGTADGVEIVTPGGRHWALSDQQARFLINTLTGLLNRR